MADTVTTSTVFSGKERAEYRFTCVSDGTGETNVIKITRSSLTNSLGVVPTAIFITELQWSIQGFSSVVFNWDLSSPEKIDVLGAGNGFRLYEPDQPPLMPAGTGGTGNVILTSNGAVAGASYDIVMKIKMSG